MTDFKVEMSQVHTYGLQPQQAFFPAGRQHDAVVHVSRVVTDVQFSFAVMVQTVQVDVGKSLT